MTIKAIETIYKGYRFRSRLEARWAVFFDALGIMWEYEPEGFEFGGAKYLPDFYIPFCNTYFEIKPISIIDTNEYRKMLNMFYDIMYHSGGDMKISALCGDPLDHHWVLPAWSDSKGFHEAWVKYTAIGYIEDENDSYFSATFSLTSFGNGMLEFINYGTGCIESFELKKEYAIDNYMHKLKARQARFEHGENP
jgi:hypothetical protein